MRKGIFLLLCNFCLIFSALSAPKKCFCRTEDGRYPAKLTWIKREGKPFSQTEAVEVDIEGCLLKEVHFKSKVPMHLGKQLPIEIDDAGEIEMKLENTHFFLKVIQ